MMEAVEQEENSQDPAFANHMLSRFIEKINNISTLFLLAQVVPHVLDNLVVV